jgi:uncharacterized protein (TIGR02271 family)
MMGKKNIDFEREGKVVGLFYEKSEAENAIQKLKDFGFEKTEISKEEVAGGILLTVNAASRAQQARQILQSCGADLETMGTSVMGSTSTGEDQERLELREEELRAEKERVEAGEVRLRKEVVKEKKTIEVPVTREEVVVERHPVSGHPADRDVGTDEEIRIPVMEEKVRVEKTPVVKEEVTAKKRTVQETREVSDTVKREEAYVDHTGDAEVRTTSSTESEPWRGSERRYHDDTHYSGPERRRAGIF